MSAVFYYCTVFDINYVDRGIVMINSLLECATDYKIYVLALDDRCYEILCEMQIDNVIVIAFEEFADDVMVRIKHERSHTEFCWTCASAFTYFLLRDKELKFCTYLDADMKFFSNPNFIVERLINSQKSIGIMQHRFCENLEKRHQIRESGKYCVEFNTFVNNDEGMRALEWWYKKSIDSCSSISTVAGFGDQKYLDEFERRFDGVYVYSEPEAGIAPWNIPDYSYDKQHNIVYKKKNIINPAFFHFHGLKIFNDGRIKLNIMMRMGRKDMEIIKRFYVPYAEEIVFERSILKEKYQLDIYDNCVEEFKGKKMSDKLKKLKEDSIIYLLDKKIRQLLHVENKDYIYIR